jgi:hypothetical protein
LYTRVFFQWFSNKIHGRYQLVKLIHGWRLLMHLQTFLTQRRVWRYQRVIRSHHFECFTVATMTWLTIMEYRCHKRPRICSTCRKYLPVFSLWWLVIGFLTRLTRRVPLLVEQELPTLPKHLSSPPVFSGVRVTRSLVLCVCFVDRCLAFCTFFCHCVVCSSSIYGFDKSIYFSPSSVTHEWFIHSFLSITNELIPWKPLYTRVFFHWFSNKIHGRYQLVKLIHGWRLLMHL